MKSRAVVIESETWVEQLADPLRNGLAYWALLATGADALPAIRNGLHHHDANVRRYCTKALDHLVDEDSFGDLLAMLDDPDPGVRWNAVHALACDRCKTTECRPDKTNVLGRAIVLLSSDPDRRVRGIAAELVGRWAHDDPTAAAALEAVHNNDPDSAVRKKAGWYAPGGPIYRKTKPVTLKGAKA